MFLVNTNRLYHLTWLTICRILCIYSHVFSVRMYVYCVVYCICRSVIGRLRNGLKIAPERYESATISFCDIVSFTTLAADSSPLQVSEVSTLWLLLLSNRHFPTFAYVRSYIHAQIRIFSTQPKPSNVFDDNNLETLFTAYLLFIINDIPLSKQYRAGQEN